LDQTIFPETKVDSHLVELHTKRSSNCYLLLLKEENF